MAGAQVEENGGVKRVSKLAVACGECADRGRYLPPVFSAHMDADSVPRMPLRRTHVGAPTHAPVSETGNAFAQSRTAPRYQRTQFGPSWRARGNVPAVMRS